MDNDRRKILKYIFGTSLLAASPLRAFDDTSKASFIYDPAESIFYKEEKKKPPRIIPQGLKKGSKVAVVAPASHASSWELRSFMKTMNQLELKVELAPTIKNYDVKYRYLSAPDEVRAAELMSYFEREDIDAIITCRGGYGVMRILHLLDFETICKYPKIVVGFSDITALLNTLYTTCGLVSYHGPAGVSTFNSITIDSFKKTLFSTSEFKPIVYTDSRIYALSPGTAQGELVGGNLTMLASTLGSEYEINTEDRILFFEEVSEEPYKFDRMLTQLYLAGKFDKVVGVIFGYYKSLDTKKYFYPNRSFTVREVIESRLKPLGIPVLMGAPFGHMKDKWTFPIGINAEINADKKYLKILEAPVK